MTEVLLSEISVWVLLALLVGMILWFMFRKPMPGSVPPSLDADTRQWERYYRAMGTQARDAGNTDSADTYASLADTYRDLAREGGDV